MQDLLATCTQYVPFLARFLHNLAHILQEMVQDFARDAARIITCKFAQFFARSHLQELVQDCARIVQEKGHITCTCQASLACKIRAQSCMILQVWEGPGIKDQGPGIKDRGSEIKDRGPGIKDREGSVPMGSGILVSQSLNAHLVCFYGTKAASLLQPAHERLLHGLGRSALYCQ